MKIYKDEKTQGLQRMIVENYLPMLNISVFRPLSGCVNFQMK